MDIKNLHRLAIEEAEILLNDISISFSIEVYFIETNTGKPNLLSTGGLEKIRKAFPKSEYITLSSSSQGTIKPHNLVGAKDLLISKTNYDELFGDTSFNEKNLHESVRKSLNKMLLAMAIKKYDYKPGANRNQATGAGRASIRADLESIGLTMDDEIIRLRLAEAYEMLKDELPITEIK